LFREGAGIALKLIAKVKEKKQRTLEILTHLDVHISLLMLAVNSEKALLLHLRNTRQLLKNTEKK